MSNHTTTSHSFYDSVMQLGNLRTPAHAERITNAVLHTLGFNLSGSTKKKLAKALPENLARALTRGWVLINIRHRKLSYEDFAKDVALHAGNTDAQYAKRTTEIVFRQIKRLINDDALSREVAKDLSPEVGKVWDAA